MKRRENILSPSSSGRHETLTLNHQTTTSNDVGCMSRLFHLLSNSQHRRPRKLLTSAKPKPQTPEIRSEKTTNTVPSDSNFKSPIIIPSEIRISKNSVNDSPEENLLQRSPALVARLMGLNELPPLEIPSPISSSEKRRKLMLALEKCNDDLKALKNIIEGMRSTTKNDDDKSRGSCFGDQVLISGEMDGSDLMVGEKSWSEDSHRCEQEQPSPVSVLDQISTSSPSPPSSNNNGNHHRYQYQIGEKYKKLREEVNNFSFCQRNTFRAFSSRQSRSTRGGRVHDLNHLLLYFSSTSSMTDKEVRVSTIPIEINTQTKVESVNEVCLNAVSAERREIKRLGLILEDFIFQELIGEIVRELRLSCYYYVYSSVFRFEGCKKRLRF